jgi:hypothetical protein
MRKVGGRAVFCVALFLTLVVIAARPARAEGIDEQPSLARTDDASYLTAIKDSAAPSPYAAFDASLRDSFWSLSAPGALI